MRFNRGFWLTLECNNTVAEDCQRCNCYKYNDKEKEETTAQNGIHLSSATPSTMLVISI